MQVYTSDLGLCPECAARASHQDSSMPAPAPLAAATATATSSTSSDPGTDLDIESADAWTRLDPCLPESCQSLFQDAEPHELDPGTVVLKYSRGMLTDY